MTTRQIPPPLTRTWVFIDFAHKIKLASTRSLHLMNRDLVLWKSASGVISLQAAYCLHMGAHLGRGKIRGELLECIFHKRAFDGNGVCVGKGKNNKSYPIIISHDMVFAWFGDTAPTWDMPDLLQPFTDDVNAKWKIMRARLFNYNFHPKDLLDNTVDASHFKTFHNQCVSYLPAQILEQSAHHFISKVVFTGSPQLKLNEEMVLDLVTESYGPCTLVVNTTVRVLKNTFFFKFIFLCTPIENENTNYTLAIAVKTQTTPKLSLGRKIMEFFYNHYAFHMQVKEFKKESEQIWQHKSYHLQPDLGAHETAIIEYTKWYEQFYINSKVEKTLLAPAPMSS
jgi:3-ketosteroid 9alpha-monooxygenase subunit A